MAVFSLTLNSRHIDLKVRGASGEMRSSDPSLSEARGQTGSGNSKKYEDINPRHIGHRDLSLSKQV